MARRKASDGPGACDCTGRAHRKASPSICILPRQPRPCAATPSRAAGRSCIPVHLSAEPRRRRCRATGLLGHSLRERLGGMRRCPGSTPKCTATRTGSGASGRLADRSGKGRRLLLLANHPEVLVLGGHVARAEVPAVHVESDRHVPLDHERVADRAAHRAVRVVVDLRAGAGRVGRRGDRDLERAVLLRCRCAAGALRLRLTRPAGSSASSQRGPSTQGTFHRTRHPVHLPHWRR